MIAIAKRNLMIYCHKISNIFFSLLGSLIFFLIYIFFLRKNLLSSMANITNNCQILDMWMLGAMLTITTMTTSLTILGQYVTDKNNNKFLDFKISHTTPASLLLGYYLSAVIVSFSMQVIIFIIVEGYFKTQEGLILNFHQIYQLVFNAFLTSIAATGFSFVICAFIKSDTSLRAVNTILGAGAGFIIGGYFPIGEMSKFAQHVIEIFPLTYSTLENRNILMIQYLKQLNLTTREHLKNYLGMSLSIDHHLVDSKMTFIILGCFSILLIIFIIFLSKSLVKTTMAERN